MVDIVKHVRRAVQLADEEGAWRTINGTPVFIKEGQSIDDAIKEKFESRSGKISKQEAAMLKQMLDKNGGFSYQPVAKSSPKDGFMISPYKDREKVLSAKVATSDDLYDYAVANSDLLSKADHHIGGWNDGDQTYLDVSVRYAERVKAMAAAEEHKQLAIFDVAKGETIYTDKEGDDNEQT
jgi:hypothetical protein